MCRSHRAAWALTLFLALPWAIAPQTTSLAMRESQTPAAARCTALGNYPVGPRAMSAHAAPGQGIQPPRSPWRLAGNIILTAYLRCGRPTAGSFSIQGDLMGMPLTQSGVTATVPCPSSCLGPSLARMTATGTFTQDAAHAHDALYVTVNTTMTSTVAGRRSRATLSHLLGYMQVSPGQNVRLTFLPPPTLSFLPPQTAQIGTLPVPIVIYGWRGM